MITKKNNYTADSIQSLEGIDHIRMRPSMYIGDVDVNGLHHLIYEVLDNSVDESLAGFCNKIWITMHKNGFITIIDNGRGIPIEIHKKEKKSALEVVMTKVGAGGKFNNSNSYKVSGGLHGVGLSCVNALSYKLIVNIYRDGKIYKQKYIKGRAINDVKNIGNTNLRGTKISFIPDKTIFNKITYNPNIVINRLRELSFLNKGLNLFFYNEFNKVKQHFFSKNGIQEYIEILEKNNNKIIKEYILIKKIQYDLSIEIAISYNTSSKEKILSYVNNINTNEGGTHVTGFRRALTRTLKKYLDEYKYNDKIEFSTNDFREGITAIISIIFRNPQFEGQTKNKLSNHEIGGNVDKVVGNHLNNYLEENPNERKKIIDKIILSARSRQAAKKARELINKKSSLNNNVLPGKLADCIFTDPTNIEIYLVEGDSAGGTAKQGRDRNFQAILPLRGKILNVEKAMQYKIFENEEIKNIFTSLGITIDSDKNINIEKLRYSKIIIMTDADIDGSHISTLILTLFFRYMQPLIEKGHIYIATPPLYLIRQGVNHKYAWNELDRENILRKLKRNKSVYIQRYKGLGEMNANQLWDTTMNPKTRTLRKIYINDKEKADNIFSILMGEDVLPRRIFIEKNAVYAKINI